MSLTLFVFDFDGTLADTFSKSPNGIDVPVAYERAIRSLFGKKGVTKFQEIGGLQNRAPGELINAMGIDATTEIVEALVQEKLRILLREIGPAWPLPFPGVLEFLKTAEERKIDTAILSSGHQAFIERTFAVWGASMPKVVVTDDDLRCRKDLAPSERVKPSRVLLDLVWSRWVLSQPLLPASRRMLYFGDDPEKDGRMAEAAGVPFCWYSPRAPNRQTQKVFVRFDDWKIAREMFFGGDTDV